MLKRFSSKLEDALDKNHETRRSQHQPQHPDEQRNSGKRATAAGSRTEGSEDRRRSGREGGHGGRGGSGGRDGDIRDGDSDEGTSLERRDRGRGPRDGYGGRSGGGRSDYSGSAVRADGGGGGGGWMWREREARHATGDKGDVRRRGGEKHDRKRESGQDEEKNNGRDRERRDRDTSKDRERRGSTARVVGREEERRGGDRASRDAGDRRRDNKAADSEGDDRRRNDRGSELGGEARKGWESGHSRDNRQSEANGRDSNADVGKQQTGGGGNSGVTMMATREDSRDKAANGGVVVGAKQQRAATRATEEEESKGKGKAEEEALSTKPVVVVGKCLSEAELTKLSVAAMKAKLKGDKATHARLMEEVSEREAALSLTDHSLQGIAPPPLISFWTLLRGVVYSVMVSYPVNYSTVAVRGRERGVWSLCFFFQEKAFFCITIVLLKSDASRVCK